MRKSRFSEDQIIAILKESEAGVETGELCRRHGIAKACIYRGLGVVPYLCPVQIISEHDLKRMCGSRLRCALLATTALGQFDVFRRSFDVLYGLATMHNLLDRTLVGLEGVVLRSMNNLRVVISPDLILQSVAVEVDRDELTPLNQGVAFTSWRLSRAAYSLIAPGSTSLPRRAFVETPGQVSVRLAFGRTQNSSDSIWKSAAHERQ